MCEDYGSRFVCVCVCVCVCMGKIKIKRLGMVLSTVVSGTDYLYMCTMASSLRLRSTSVTELLNITIHNVTYKNN